MKGPLAEALFHLLQGLGACLMRERGFGLGQTLTCELCGTWRARVLGLCCSPRIRIGTSTGLDGGSVSATNRESSEKIVSINGASIRR
jgi:hypothetical protein